LQVCLQKDNKTKSILNFIEETMQQDLLKDAIALEAAWIVMYVNRIIVGCCISKEMIINPENQKKLKKKRFLFQWL
jgi:hypothetical protein